MRHRGPKQTPKLISSDQHPQPRRFLPQTTSAQAARRLTAITAALAALAASGVAVAIGTSLAAATPSPVATNLISNPGFESGLTGWTGSASGVTTSTTHHSGVSAALLKGQSGHAVNVSVTTAATEATNAGGIYHATVWVAAPGGVAHATLRLRELHAGSIVGQQLVRLYVGNARWRQLTLAYTATATGDTLSFAVVANSLAPGHSLLVDDASLFGPNGASPSASSTATDPVPTATATGTPAPSATATPSLSPKSPSPSVTPPPPTPTTSPRTGGRALIGTSFGGSLSTAEAQFPNMRVARFYYPGAPSVWGGGMASIPAGQVIFVSFNYDVAATEAGTYDAAFTQVLRSWAASGRTIYWTWQHEADNPSNNISQAAYRAGWDRLLADAATVNAPNLHSMSILMAIALTGVHGPIEGWYVPGVDVLGFDSYYLSTELLAEQYAAAKGKPLAFPEFGSSIGGSSDATSAAFAQQFIAALDANTIGACWYDNLGNNFSTHPLTLAVLRAAAG